MQGSAAKEKEVPRMQLAQSEFPDRSRLSRNLQVLPKCSRPLVPDRFQGQPHAGVRPLPAGLAPEGVVLARGPRGQPLLVPGVPARPRRPPLLRALQEAAQGDGGQEAVQADRRDRPGLPPERDRPARPEAQEVRLRGQATVSVRSGVFGRRARCACRAQKRGMCELWGNALPNDGFSIIGTPVPDVARISSFSLCLRDGAMMQRRRISVGCESRHCAGNGGNFWLMTPRQRCQSRIVHCVVQRAPLWMRNKRPDPFPRRALLLAPQSLF